MSTIPLDCATGIWAGNFTKGVMPVAVYQVHLDIPAGGQEEVVFVLGEVENPTSLAAMVDKWAQAGNNRACV